jgi:hypothetical protein
VIQVILGIQCKWTIKLSASTTVTVFNTADYKLNFNYSTTNKSGYVNSTFIQYVTQKNLDVVSPCVPCNCKQKVSLVINLKNFSSLLLTCNLSIK